RQGLAVRAVVVGDEDRGHPSDGQPARAVVPASPSRNPEYRVVYQRHSKPGYNARVGENDTAYRRFSDFYPYYLSEHRNRTCRRLHFLGTTLGLIAVLHAFATLNFWWLLAGLVAGYAFAWVGHFF